MNDFKSSYFDADKYLEKYDSDATFDLIKIRNFHNTSISSVFSYMVFWLLSILSVLWLASDVYTCLNILVFHRWSTEDYRPYAYSTAKWIFTGCIIFEFLLYGYHWFRGIQAFRTGHVTRVYMNNIAKGLYRMKSYDYHCFFCMIEHDNFFDWICFLAYSEMDGAFQILCADTPRQVINLLTLRYYATDKNSSNDIIHNIQEIADTNVHLSIILSLMCFSLIIWCIFFFKFALGLISYLPVLHKVRKKGYSTIKKYCCVVVVDIMKILIVKNRSYVKNIDGDNSTDYVNVQNPFSDSTQSFLQSEIGYSMQTLRDITKPSSRMQTAPTEYRYNSYSDNNYSKTSLINPYSATNISLDAFSTANTSNQNFSESNEDTHLKNDTLHRGDIKISNDIDSLDNGYYRGNKKYRNISYDNVNHSSTAHLEKFNSKNSSIKSDETTEEEGNPFSTSEIDLPYPVNFTDNHKSL